MQRMMRQVGPSVFLTSVTGKSNKYLHTNLTAPQLHTDAFVFIFGASSSMPAVQQFCIQAWLCLLAVVFLLMLLFAPIVVLDARREQVLPQIDRLDGWLD